MTEDDAAKESAEAGEAAPARQGKPTDDLKNMGLVRLTPDLMEKIGEDLKARQADIDARYPQLIADCPYEVKLAVTAWVFGNIVENATQGGSFRHLIYDLMGFGPDAYYPLYTAGGMMITNELDLREEV